MCHSPTCISQATYIRILWQLVQLKCFYQVLGNRTCFFTFKHEVKLCRSSSIFPSLEHFDYIIHKMICCSWLTIQVKNLTCIFTHRKGNHCHWSIRLEQAKWWFCQPNQFISKIKRLVLIGVIEYILNKITDFLQWVFRAYI